MSDWNQWLQKLQQASFNSSLKRCDLDVRSRLARAQDLILKQYDAPLDLDRLARQACYSRYHFLRVYQQAYGVTPHQDLTRARMQAARRLLEETELPVTDICFAVGFRSPGSFSSLFRRHMGSSPSRWRRRYRPSVWIAPRIPACFMGRFAIMEKSPQ